MVENKRFQWRGRSWRKRHDVCLLIFVCILIEHQNTNAFSLKDWLQGYHHPHDKYNVKSTSSTLSSSDVYQMRVRDLRRRLTRQHGYSASEIAKMIDKQELINALLYEEHKVHEWGEKQRRRTMYRRSIIAALVCIVIVMLRDLWIQIYDMVSVNFVVYTDKKKYELSRCIEFKSFKGAIGIAFMCVVDCLQVWLSMSVLLSWFMVSSYFFPIPNIPIRPAALLASMVGSSNSSAGPFSNYGINIGPMIITWLLRFSYGQIESWTGRKLSESYKRRKQEAKMSQKNDAMKVEEEEMRRKRKEERRVAREERRRQQQQQHEKEVLHSQDPMTGEFLSNEKISSQGSCKENVHVVDGKADERKAYYATTSLDSGSMNALD